MNPIRLFLIALALALGACVPNRQSEAPEISIVPEVTLVSSPTKIQATVTATNTSIPSVTPSPTKTPDLSPASMSSLAGDLLCRFGPGSRYGVGGWLREGVSVAIRARNGAGDWFQFELPGLAGKYCWVASRDVHALGNLGPLDIAQAPLSFVTHVEVLLDPPKIEPVACVFPLTFNVTFTIETIGPTFVTFERSQSNGTSAPLETVEFIQAGVRTFEDYLRVDAAGEHWFRISVSRPNRVEGQGVGVVICP